MFAEYNQIVGRWCVYNADGMLLAQFTTGKQAQQYIRDQKD